MPQTSQKQHRGWTDRQTTTWKYDVSFSTAYWCTAQAKFTLAK